MNLELKKAIDQISKDKGLDRDMLIKTLEDAVRTSVQRRFSEDMDVEVRYNDNTGDIEVYQFKIVVEDGEVENEDTHIGITEARTHDPSVQIDDEVGFRVKVEDLGRTEAILPREEQIPREHYKRNDRVQAIIIDVRKEGRGPQVVVSRAHRDYMAALFRREVPEVDDGVVQIMGVARDPGSRAKVAVLSRERDVDPVGACVGVRGSRIQNIVQELRGERIDIVVWSPDIATYARNALAPAMVSRIVVDEEENLLEVIVPDDQLTNAIGRKGQNVKLAARLLGWKVDIFTETRYNEANAIGHGLEQVASVAEVSMNQLLEAGYTSLDLLRQATDEELSDKLAISDSRIADLRSAINFLAPVAEPEPRAAEEETTDAGNGEKVQDGDED